MKLKLMDMERFTQGLTPVTSVESTTRTGELNPEGLFSEKIFGIEGSIDRTKNYSYIDLGTKLIHPSVFMILKRLDQKLISMFSTDETFKINSAGQVLQDDKGFTGIPEFVKIFDKIKFRGGTESRDELIKVIKQSSKDGTLFVDKLPVIPPEFRPEYEDDKGKTIIDELNEIYVNIMRRVTQLSGIGSGPVYDVLVYGLQLALNSHDKYVKQKVSKKHGLIRNAILGKRVDFSGRAVIVPGPEININQIGLPLRLVVPLFEPFFVHYFLYSQNQQIKKTFRIEAEKYLETSLSVESITRLFRSLKKGAVLPIELRKLIFDAAEVIMKGRVIIAKRDPVLHDGGYRAFYPILIEGNVIQMCTLQVKPFNADFDGDQMGFFHPLSDQAQEEAKEKMTRLVGAGHSHDTMFELSKEMVTGLYNMTKNIKRTQSPIGVTEADLETAVDPFIAVKYRGQNTTMGRAIFNSAFPPSMPFIDKVITKSVVNGYINETIKRFGEPVTAQIFSKLERTGFKFATIFGTSLTIDMFEIPDSIKELKKKISNSSPEEVNRLENQMIAILKDHLKGTGMHDFLESGAGKGWSQPKQILIAKGMITDTKGKLLDPIEGSFSGGLTTTEYFHAAVGARKGMADRVLNTADTGYFTRQLVYMLSPVEASKNIKDCRTKRTVQMKLNSDSIGRLDGRFHIKGNRIVEFNKNDYKIGDIINLRSPIFCETKKLCLTCYGNLVLRHKSPYVGIIAGSKIGERGTQLIMRTFHTGGAATIAISNVLKDIVDNDPLLGMSAQQLTKYFEQTDTIINTKKPVKITVDLNGYRKNDNIQYPDSGNSEYDGVWFNHLVSQVEFADLVFNMSLDYAVVLKGDYQTINNSLIFEYNANEPILTVPTTVVEIKEQVNYIKRLLGGKMVYKDPFHLLNKILKVYGGTISDFDMVHFEVMASQVLRDRKNPAIPARLGKTWDPIMANVKENIFSTSFIQGLAFENIGKAIQVGLIEKSEFDQPTIFEKLLAPEKG